MSKKKATAISLPLSRTAKIMHSAVGIESVDQDIVALATKATEIFLTDFARRAYENSDSNVLEYKDIQDLVHSDPRYDFLIDTTPKRIKFSEALALIEKAKQLERESMALREPPPKSPTPQDPHPQSTPQSPAPSPSPAPPSDMPIDRTASQSEASEVASNHQDSSIENNSEGEEDSNGL